MTTTAYIYDEDTNKCLLVITGEKSSVEREAAAQFEQNGYPAVYDPAKLRGVAEAETQTV